MLLDSAQCYEALRSRDRRFDGRFFTGVTSTGIYCRPICTARCPKQANCRFFPTAAAAEEAGFRPCKICRPERSAGLPAVPDGSPLVARALSMIDAGVLDEQGVDALAARIALSTRQLRRLFADHLGASPLAIGKARRVHFAKRLIDDTAMSMAEIAFASGFGSVRQFNHDIRSTFRVTPTDLKRRRGAKHPAAAQPGAVTLSLATRPPYDWDTMRSFFAARTITGVESVDADTYRRIAGDGTVIEARATDATTIALTVFAPAGANLIGIAERARRLFDLRADPMRIAETLSSDPMLAPLVKQRPGQRLPGAWDGFEAGVRAIAGQRISVAAARTILGRFASIYGKPVEGFEHLGLTHAFPAPETVAGAGPDGIPSLPQSSRRSIVALAEACADGRIAFDGSLSLDALVEALCELPGIGVWSAHYVAMRACGEPDAFPVGDLGLRKAASMTDAALAERAEAWRPWRAYAAMHLWSSLSG